MKNYIFNELKLFLNSKSVNIDTRLSDDEFISGLGSLELAKINDITFFNNYKYIDLLRKTKAKACFITKENIKFLPQSCLYIIVDDPYLAYALSTNFFNPIAKSNKIIDDNVKIHKNSYLGSGVQINSFVSIDENTKIGDNCILLENSTIGPNVEIDNNSIIMSNCVITNTSIGKNSIIQSGSIIGGKGFGFTPKLKIDIKHIGNVIIGNNVEIGSNTTIDRATLDSTIIEDNVRIDNLVQIAHNVKIKKDTIIAAQTGIAGSTEIGKSCIIGGQVGISGHLIIGNNVTIAGKSGVTKNIKDNSVIAGFPAIDIKKWKKNIINQLKNSK